MEDVKKYRVPVVITKKGRPVAKLMPPDEPATDVVGCMVGTARIVGDVEAPVLSPKAWKATAARRRAR
jgi:antitoxin (DNA-binding transcriptional repressor) of toxin-antitoxin stability system